MNASIQVEIKAVQNDSSKFENVSSSNLSFDSNQTANVSNHISNLTVNNSI